MELARGALDVLICTYNNSHLLAQVLERLERQAVPDGIPWGVLVIENNCTDDTRAVVERYIARGRIPRLRLISERRQGQTFARICGVRHTQGEWIAFVDDDCLLSETWVANAMRFATSHPLCGAFGGKNILMWEQAPSELLLRHSDAFAAQDYGDQPMRMPETPPPTIHHPVGAGLVVRREALERSGWCQRQFMVGRAAKVLTSGDDAELALQIRHAGYELWYTPECVLHHYMPAKRISEQYLGHLVQGFGCAFPLLQGLVWRGSYASWCLMAHVRALKALLTACLLTLAGFVTRRLRAESALRWRHFKGQVLGIWSVQQMAPDVRKVWLGAAKSTGPAA